MSGVSQFRISGGSGAHPETVHHTAHHGCGKSNVVNTKVCSKLVLSDGLGNSKILNV